MAEFCDPQCYYSRVLRRTVHLSSLFAAALLAVSCGPAAAPHTQAAGEATIRALDEQWSATAAKGDLEGTLAFYSADAVLLPPNAPIAADQKSIRESWAGLLVPGTIVSWKVSRVEVAKSGELGYLYGTYRLAIKDPKGGPTVNDTGKILEIWKKQPDGKWKCIVDTYNSDIPVPAVADAKK
jgi:ketosteroid isomerase-like protein